jgi:tetratricopeptide (TPR) repeat protein
MRTAENHHRQCRCYWWKWWGCYPRRPLHDLGLAFLVASVWFALWAGLRPAFAGEHWPTPTLAMATALEAPQSQNSTPQESAREPASSKPRVTGPAGDRQGPVPDGSPSEGSSPPRSAEGPDISSPRSPTVVSPAESVLNLEPASFKGIIPGKSTLAEVQTQWGPPKEVASRGQDLVYLYSVDPFDHVEVVGRGELVEAVVVRLSRPFPAQAVAEHLQLSVFSPVLVANERGEVLGQAFPERGVILAFVPASAPGQASFQTSEIVLQPLSGEMFLLRAEGSLWTDPDRSLQDVEIALRLSPGLARAHWVRARLLALRGDWKAAEEACQNALKLQPLEANYHLTLGEVLQRQGRLEEARQSLQRAESLAGDRGHIKARVPCILAELATRRSPPDYSQALEHYVEAIRRAEPLAASEFPALRVAAKETLLDAFLGAADCIAFGKWRQKEIALPQWWERAENVAADLVSSEGRPVDLQIHVFLRALTASAALRGLVDPTPYAEKLLQLAPQVVPQSSQSFGQKSWREVRRRREIAQALYQAALTLQNAGKLEKAIEFAQQAAEYLEPIVSEGQNPEVSDQLLLGKIYFRIGAAYAVGKNDHTQAARWFDRALPRLTPELEEKLTPPERGTVGEMLVSMGVSYWEIGNRDLGYQLTERGVQLIEQAVQKGQLPRSALAAPYANLGTMERQRGNQAEADRYLRQAQQLRGGILR